jgi:hypothetical protein
MYLASPYDPGWDESPPPAVTPPSSIWGESLVSSGEAEGLVKRGECLATAATMSGPLSSCGKNIRRVGINHGLATEFRDSKDHT